MTGPPVVHDPNDPSRDCTRLYPVYSFPRGVAGQSIANDVIVCQLKPIDWSVTRLPTRKTWYSCKRLCRHLPDGVCDYSKPGVEQQPPLGTWLDYGTD